MKLNRLYILFLFVSISLLISCESNDPKKEDVPELITKVTLTFTPATGDPVVVTATDPDGEGVQNIQNDGPINLKSNTTYMLTIQLINGLAQPTDEAYDVTKEVRSEGVEHMFFFSWTGLAFSSPGGNGNVDNRNDKMNYTGGSDSIDASGLSLGLTTTWETTDVKVVDATFRVLLKHQPGLKSSTSTSSDGETDLDVSFDLNVN
ncbi:MAG: hypothetical protein WDO14_02010 [Bacteroidota bacterium]